MKLVTDLNHDKCDDRFHKSIKMKVKILSWNVRGLNQGKTGLSN